LLNHFRSRERRRRRRNWLIRQLRI
jgi:hypothetical protein